MSIGLWHRWITTHRYRWLVLVVAVALADIVVGAWLIRWELSLLGLWND